MKGPATTLEELIKSASSEFVTRIKDVAGEDPNINSAVVNMAVRDVSWFLLEAFPNKQHELSEMLELMGQAVRDEELEN